MLSILWFILIAVLWIGYLVLEGFDLGVAMLLPFVSKNDKERTTALKTIGPHWDGNEVWLLTAVAPCSPHSPSVLRHVPRTVRCARPADPAYRRS